MTELRGNFKGNKSPPENCPLCGNYDTTEHILECEMNEKRIENINLKDSSTENLMKTRRVFKETIEARETKKETT